MHVLLLCLSCLLARVNGEYKELFETYKTQIEELLKDQQKLTEMYDCLMDAGSCDNYKMIKEIVPKIVANKCSDCTPEQKGLYDKVFKAIQEKYSISAKELYDDITKPSNLTTDQQDLFEMDVLKLMNDTKEVKAIFDCLMDLGSCDKYEYFKEMIPKIYRNKCDGCSEKEKNLFAKARIQFMEKYPDLDKQLAEKLTRKLTDEEQFFEIEIQGLKNVTVAKELLDCLLDRPGPCEKFKKFIHLVPELIKTKCEKCTPANKKKYDFFENVFKEHFSFDYLALLEKIKKKPN